MRFIGRLQNFDLAIEMMANHASGKLLMLVIMEDVFLDKELTDHAKSKVRAKGRIKVARVACVGVEGVNTILIETYSNVFFGATMKPFKTEAEAKAWLVS